MRTSKGQNVHILFWQARSVNGLVHLLHKTECLNEHIFGNLAEARKIIENWRIDYNTHRPHTSLGGLAPAVYAKLNRSDRPASPELRNGSAQQALTANQSVKTNVNGFYT